MTPPSGSARIKTGKPLSLLSHGLGRVEEGRLPVSPKLLLGKNPLPPLPLVLLPLPGRMGVMPASWEPSPRRQPLRPSATLSSMHWVTAVPVESAARSFCLLSWLTLLCPGLPPDLEWALVSQASICSGCCSGICLRPWWSWGPLEGSAPPAQARLLCSQLHVLLAHWVQHLLYASRDSAPGSTLPSTALSTYYTWYT